MGDINARTKQWGEIPNIHATSRGLPELDDQQDQYEPESMARVSQDIYSNTYGTTFIKLCKDNNLVIANGRTNGDRRGMYTSYQPLGFSVIDYCACTPDIYARVKQFRVDTLRGDITDHSMIQVTIKSRYKPEVTKGPTGTYCNIPRFQWSLEGIKKYQETLQSPAVTIELKLLEQRYRFDTPSQEKVDQLIGKLNAIILSAAKKSTPYRVQKARGKSRPKHKKWFDSECRDLRRTVQKLGRKVSGGDTAARSPFFTFRKQYKRLLKYKLSSFKKDILTKMYDTDMKDPSQYWQLMKELRNQEFKITGTTIPLDEWEKHFRKLFKVDEPEEKDTGKDQAGGPGVPKNTDKINEQPTIFNEMDRLITKDEVITSVNKTKMGKSIYIDGISNELLRHGVHVLAGHLCWMFNYVFSSGIYPNVWKGAYLTPVYKRGDRSVTGNYRGLAISSCLGKVMNRVLNNRLADFMDESGAAHIYQTGFEKGSRTVDHVFTLSTIIEQCKHEGKKIYTCFIDLTKAYDYVDRTILIQKMRDLGVGSKFLQMIASMYDRVEYSVKINGLMTPLFRTRRGLKQGDVLSPKLFNLYINDLIRTLMAVGDHPMVNGVPVPGLFFADDLVALAPTPKGLQDKLDAIETYCGINRMEVNTTKTKTMTLGKKTRTQRGQGNTWYIHGVALENVDTFTYLGMDFMAKGAEIVTNNSVLTKAVRAQNALASYSGLMPAGLGMCMHRQLVEPILMYGSEIWAVNTVPAKGVTTKIAEVLNDSSAKQIPSDGLQMSFMKRILGQKPNAINVAVRGELGSYPLYIKAIVQAVKFWNRLDTMEQGPLAKEAFEDQKKMVTQGQACWASKLVSTVSMVLGRTVDIELPPPHKEVCTALIRDYESYWFEALWSFSRLAMYRQIKKDIVCEPYLLEKNWRLRQATTRFRTSTHNLAIETGRHNRTSPADRLCTICHAGQVEDELHLFQCPEYAGIRTAVGLGQVGRDEFHNLMTECDRQTMVYIFHAIKRREVVHKEMETQAGAEQAQ